jgi:hypothetical protein
MNGLAENNRDKSHRSDAKALRASRKAGRQSRFNLGRLERLWCLLTLNHFLDETGM